MVSPPPFGLLYKLRTVFPLDVALEVALLRTAVVAALHITLEGLLPCVGAHVRRQMASHAAPVVAALLGTPIRFLTRVRADVARERVLAAEGQAAVFVVADVRFLSRMRADVDHQLAPLARPERAVRAFVRLGPVVRLLVLGEGALAAAAVVAPHHSALEGLLAGVCAHVSTQLALEAPPVLAARERTLLVPAVLLKVVEIVEVLVVLVVAAR